MNVDVRSERLDLISICTGGGGLDLGVELAIPCARTVCMVEREGFACAQLVSAMEAGLMAAAPVWSDARTFDGRAWRGAVDGLIGGIPCQPHSLAGRKRGQNDERDLWSDARRIIVQSRAWFVLIENVSGMLSAGDDEIAGAERVYRDLHKLGFAVEGGLFTASEVGASHKRERVFILAVADGVGGRLWREGYSIKPPAGPYRSCGKLDRRTPSEIFDEFQRNGFMEYAPGDRWGEGRPEPDIRRGRNTAAGASLTVVDAIRGGHARQSHDTIGSTVGRTVIEWPGRDSFPSLYPPRPSDLDSWRRVLAHSPHLEPAVRRMANGVAARLDLAGPHAARIERLRMLGNGVVPLQAAYAIRTLATRLAARGSAGAARLVRMMGLEQ